MPITKNALIRYQTLDRCFSNIGKRYFIEDLFEACNAALTENDPNNTGIQLRQLRADISFMKSKERSKSTRLNSSHVVTSRMPSSA